MNILIVLIILFILLMGYYYVYRPKKIAFCFLIYDEIIHEDLWYNFFKNADPNKYSIYIHYKTDKPLKYFDKYKLKHTIETKWGDNTLTKAHILLFKEALKDKSNYKFVNVSQSCIPLKNFDYVYNFLTRDNNSHFNITECNDYIKHKLGHKYNKILKSSNWFILNKKHTENVTNTKDVDLFEDIPSPEEIFFITYLTNKYPSYIKTTPNLSDGATTFTNWSDMPYKFGDGGSPKNYDNISNEELSHLINSPSLFGRKFKSGCKINDSEDLNNSKLLNNLYTK